MGNEEYKEIMDELYKFLRDKISLALGEYLSDEAKEKLFAYDFESNIVVGLTSNKIIEYKFSDDKIYICDEFLTPDYIEKVKEKNPEFDLTDLKNKVNAENPKVLLEELIAFCTDLKITEKDLIKSLFIQEILKMILMDSEMDAKTDAIMTGTIELLAHDIGSQNGFLVSTPKKYESELDVAIGLREEFDDKFKEIVLKGNVLDYLSRINNSRLLEKINELADERKIIESTQNLDNVIDSIVNITNENQEIIDNVKEKEVKEEVQPMESLDEEKKEDIIEIADEEVTNEQVVNIPEENNLVQEQPLENNTEETYTYNQEGTNNISNELTQESAQDTDTKSFIKKNKNIVIYSITVLITVMLGILIGYLLFKFK